MMPVPGSSDVTQRQADAPAEVCISPLPPNRAVIQTEAGKEVVMVPPAPFEVLQVLAERPGRDYSFSEILQQILPGKEPTEPSLGINKEMLAARVTKLRRALNPACRRLQSDPSYDCIVNTRGYGYRLNAVREPLRTRSIFDAFRNTPAALKRHIALSVFENLVDERTQGFVGRRYIFDEIDGLLADPGFASGYIVIQGEPGIGKTALIAQLVQKRGYVHHFNIAAQGINRARHFLANTSAQLIVWYGLPHRTLPPEVTEDSSFLLQLLTEAAERAKDQQVVVLIDALDEAEDPDLLPDANCLFLPPLLPEGVFFVITSREQADYRLLVDQRKDIYLHDNDPNNIEDVRHYIQGYVQRYANRMAARIAEWGIDEKDFVEVLAKKSQGNFMYLVFVLKDIKSGRLTRANVDDIRHLPQGLESYYRRHWRTMRVQDKERFEKYYERVVLFLAAAMEPICMEQLAEWTELPPRRIREVIDDWREFLNVDEGPQGEPRYYIYHTSFQDFLRDEIGLKPYHNEIVDKGLRKIRGFHISDS